MIVKLIQCAVYKDKTSQFSTSQKAWSALSNAPGFIAQFGGWADVTNDNLNENNEDENNSENPLAVIIGFWESIDTYQHFMENIHDSIFTENEQATSYDSSRSSVTLWSNKKFSDHSSGNRTDITISAKQIVEKLSQAPSFSFCMLDDIDGISDRIDDSTMLIFNPLDKQGGIHHRLVISTIPTTDTKTINNESSWLVI